MTDASRQTTRTISAGALGFWIAIAIICVGLGTGLLGLACTRSDATSAPHAKATVTAPRLLSETGLYASQGEIDTTNQPFVPQYPLWTDGAEKARWVFIPEGARIDISNVDIWKFPVGTKFWKEFAWEGRKVETRLIWKTSEVDWVFATYVWNEDQSEAFLAPPDGVPGAIEVASNKRHSIPSLQDCSSCHQSSQATVLGFNALQLSDDRDPLAPNKEPMVPGALTLRSLLESDRLVPARTELASKPPRIRADSPTARAAMGYLSGNCGGCHNDTGPLARLGLNLLHKVGSDNGDTEPALLSTLNARGRFVIPGMPADSSALLVAGAPDHSAILHRMKSRRPSAQMPPLGTVIVDDQAVELIQNWIAGLGTDQLP